MMAFKDPKERTRMQKGRVSPAHTEIMMVGMYGGPEKGPSTV